MKWLDKIKKHAKSKKFFQGLRRLFLVFTILFFTGNLILIYGFRVIPDTSFTALSFTLLSITIACHSVVIAIDSDEKMKSIATGDFYELSSNFWARAPLLYNNNLKKGVRGTQSWQLLNYFRHADKLKMWADTKIQEELIGQFTYFLEELQKTTGKKYPNEIKNYITICEIALKFNTKDDKIKNNLIDELAKWLGEKKKEESNKEYLDKKEKEISN